MPRFSDSVFINCPFDKQYWPTFEGIVFCVIRCGFVPRCALEEADSGQVRLEMLQRIIRDSQYTIHDLSRIELSVESALPRFNMPFELGMDLGCRLSTALANSKARNASSSMPSRIGIRPSYLISPVRISSIITTRPIERSPWFETGCGRPVGQICPDRRRSSVSFWNSRPGYRSIATRTHLTGTTSNSLNM